MTSSFFFFFLQRKEYVKYAKVFPLSEALDIKIPPKWYRRIVGSMEIICGLALSLVPSSKLIIIIIFLHPPPSLPFLHYYFLQFKIFYFLFTDKVKYGANVILLFLMLMAVYSHYMVNDKFERIAPALVTYDIY